MKLGDIMDLLHAQGCRVVWITDGENKVETVFMSDYYSGNSNYKSSDKVRRMDLVGMPVLEVW